MRLGEISTEKKLLNFFRFPNERMFKHKQVKQFLSASGIIFLMDSTLMYGLLTENICEFETTIN